MSREVAYLRIPDDYEGNRYSLRWSAAGDAVEHPDGTTFAFAAEIALFLEGYVSVGPLIHFSYILSLLRRLGEEPKGPSGPALLVFGLGWELLRRSDDLATAFREAGRPLRNAGALCAWLCRDVPAAVDSPDPMEVCLRLAHGSMASALAVHRVATAPLGAESGPLPMGAIDFEMGFLNALKRATAAEVESWLRHGRPPPADPGDRVAGTIAALRPRTLEAALEALAGRDRIAAAVPIVSQLVASLTLPPRRLARAALPTGGYADVSTRGRPEEILPSQFAVDDVEFLRRFAENELLYFHREEPHAPVTEELVILLDQGVRTWGRVRHALSASAIAFGRLAARRGLALLVGGTSSGGALVDPIEADDEALGALWEASDLTPGPGPALERVLGRPGGTRRDVVVLTHPRNVAEPGFAAATGGAAAGTRVFSVAIDEPGQVQFREWRRCVPVKIGDFRVDFAPTSPAPRPPARPDPGFDPRGWRGDVEPVGFPFRLGMLHRMERPLFDFDHSGRWLLLCTHRGMLHAWRVEGSMAEVLPRARVGDDVLEQVDAVLGVADGFVVGGRVGRSLVAMHYDFTSRTARASVLSPSSEGEWLWAYSRESHVVVARGRDLARALDLSTGAVFRPDDPAVPTPARVGLAFAMAADLSVPPPGLAIVDEGTPDPGRGGAVRLDRATGEIELSRVVPPWEAFRPLSDGRPDLRGFWVDHAQLRGGVLALVVRAPGRDRRQLRLFCGPAGVPTRTLDPLSSRPGSFVLSPDGRWIARRVGGRQLEVRETFGTPHPVLVTAKGKAHPDPTVTLGRYGMVIRVGRHANLIRWDGDRLAVSTLPDGSTRVDGEGTPWPIDRPATRSTPRPSILDYDPRRFIACARAELTAVVDVLGQVALFDADDRLVAMFIASRSLVAAWMPDGTRFGPTQGPSPLIDGPITRDTAAIIGRALKAASDSATGVRRALGR